MHVTTRTESWICAALWAVLVAAPAAAAGDAAALKDFTSVIALLGLPCGQVVSVTPLKNDEHIATCQDGNRYRLHVNAEGRVVAQRLSL
jgi:anti-sigma-K factor RskA